MSLAFPWPAAASGGDGHEAWGPIDPAPCPWVDVCPTSPEDEATHHLPHGPTQDLALCSPTRKAEPLYHAWDPVCRSGSVRDPDQIPSCLIPSQALCPHKPQALAPLICFS